MSGRPSAGATKCRRVLLKHSKASALYPQQCGEGSGREDRDVPMGWSGGRGMKFNRMESEVVCLGREETFHCKASASARPRWCQLAERTAGSCQRDRAGRRANTNRELSDPWERREPGLGTNVCVSSHHCSGERSLGWNCLFGDCKREGRTSAELLTSGKGNCDDGDDIGHECIGSVNPVKGGELIWLMNSAAQQQIPMNKCKLGGI